MFLSITDKHVTNKAFILLHTQPAPYTAAAKRPLRERSDSSGLVRCTLYTTEHLRKWVRAQPGLVGEFDDEDFRAGGRDDAVVRDHAQNGRHVHRERVGGERRFAKAADVDGIV